MAATDSAKPADEVVTLQEGRSSTYTDTNLEPKPTLLQKPKPEPKPELKTCSTNSSSGYQVKQVPNKPVEPSSWNYCLPNTPVRNHSAAVLGF